MNSARRRNEPAHCISAQRQATDTMPEAGMALYHRLATTAALLAGLAVCSAKIAPGQPAVGPEPSLDPGDQAHYATGIDSVDPFSGQLALTIPIGQRYDVGPGLSFQLRLHYTSQIWAPGKWIIVGSTVQPHMLLQGDPALGPGWRLSMGQIVEVTSGTPFAYVAPDGSTHQLFNRRFFDTPTSDGFYYTRDSSYIRVKYLGDTQGYQLWTPDGNLTTLSQKVTGLDDPVDSYTSDFGRGRNGWHATSIRNPYGDAITVTYQTNYPWVPYQISIPSLGNTPASRTITVSMTGARITSFSLPTWGSQAAVYTLSYSSPAQTLFRPVPLPTQYTAAISNVQTLSLPPTGNYTASYTFHYHPDFPSPQTPYAAGALRSQTIPTGATITYTYGTWSFYRANKLNYYAHNCAPYPPGPLPPALPAYRTGPGVEPALPALGACAVIDRHAGLVQRQIDFDGATTSYWQYNFPQGESGSNETAQTETVVVSPTNAGGQRHSTSYLFNAATTLGATGPIVGGPARIARFADDATGAEFGYLHLPSSLPVCNYSSFFCVNNALRYEDILYETDSNDLNLTTADNRRVVRRTTHFNSGSVSPGKYTQVEYVWDRGSGHYTQETRTENISSPPVQKVIVTAWLPVITTNEWRMDVPTSVALKPSSTGAALVTVTNTFDSHGFVTVSATADGSPEGAGTLTRTAPRDTHGFPTSETHTLGATSYTTVLAYQSAALRTAHWGAGAGIGWNSVDNEIDANTGFVSKAWDPNRYRTGGNALYTTQTYDPLGRPLLTTPPNGEATTDVTYDSPTQATTSIKKGTSEYAWTQVQLDPLGRVAKVRRKLPGGVISKRTHAYDKQGNQVFESEWAADSASDASLRGASFLDYDDFGRPKRITRADDMPGHNSTSRVTYADPANPGAYANSVWYQKVTVENISGVSADTQYTHDGFGRLVSVIEPVGNYTTSYEYDIADRLRGVTQGQQTRSFVFDAFGFLRKEVTPEKGGPSRYVTYSYDALGNVITENQPIGIILTSSYDTAGRLREIKDGAQQRYAVYCYDGAVCPDGSAGFAGGSYPLGRLTRRIGLTPDYGSPAPRITEDFTYSEPGGRLSQKATAIEIAGITPPTTTERWFYDPAGALVRYDHPRASGLFAETSDLDYGLPVRVAVNGIPVASATYHVSGSLATIVTGTGAHDVTTTIAHDDTTMMARPLSISTSGALSSNFSTGTLAYDGAGNITAMGADAFGYDKQSRLIQATLSGLGQQTLEYDRYGSLTSKTGGPGDITYQVDPATNRLLSPAQYDDRGNLTRSPAGELFTWDNLSRLVRSQFASYTWKYLYDGSGERVVKVPPEGQTYFYTFRDPARRFVTEYQGPGVVRDNVYLGNLLVASSSTCQGGGQTLSFFSSDHLGTPRLVTDTNGNALETRRYWPYGEDAGNPVSAQRTRFAGMEYELEEPSTTGIGSANRYYVHARTYDFGSVGRFLRPDPVLGDLSDPQRWNRYTYVLDNPLRYIDPLGLDDLPMVGHGDPPGVGAQFDYRVFTPSADMPHLDVGLTVTAGEITTLEGTQFYATSPESKAPQGALGTRPISRSELKFRRCSALQTVLERERRHGPLRAAWMSGNTFGDHTLEPFNSSLFGNVDSDYGMIDLDWFTDIRATAIHPGLAGPAYVSGKLWWSYLRWTSGAPIGTALPFQDDGETSAFLANIEGLGYATLFPPAYVSKWCD